VSKRPNKIPAFVLIWVIGILIFTAAAVVVPRCGRGAEVPFEATCRITEPGGGRGSGIVFEVSGQTVYVLTCAHVVGKSNSVRCDFWRAGHQSPGFAGTVWSRDASADAAIVTVSLSSFGGNAPAAIPLAERGTLLEPGDTIVSAGCPGGGWSTAFEGHVLGYDGRDLVFRPAPADGRSGSALLNADGTAIVGLVRARAIDGSFGKAVSVGTLYAAFETKTQCLGGQCDRYPQRRLGLEMRGPRGAEFRLGGEVGPQPGSYQVPSPWRAPQAVPGPRIELQAPLPQPYIVQAPTDLGPLERKLDRNHDTMDRGLTRIADLLERRNTQPPVVLPVVPVEPEPETRLIPVPTPLVDEQARQDATEAKAETSRLRTVVEQVIGDRDTLKQRFDERWAKAEEDSDSKVETAKRYAADLVAEKLSDGSAGLTMGKILAGTLGLSGPLGAALIAAGWLASRRVGKRIRRRLADGTVEIEENP
jgi:hypothetical protein